ncbi:helix-turn-helix transcriptional regulator [Amycolatopsis keratiniphila]|uniref:helix-turn-helix transcriptional regulator n=1 Tax=Amycolatopsis keratiniphila TaxID=129921 RepID=UPI0009FB13F8|nr:helix-turn-helix domain-containing protein [Amycolatopsis keratiniphila]
MPSTPRAANRAPRLRQPISAPTGDDEHLTIKEVCAVLKIARSTFSDWRDRGEAPPCTRLPNNQIRVSRLALNNWLASRLEAA